MFCEQCETETEAPHHHDGAELCETCYMIVTDGVLDVSE